MSLIALTKRFMNQRSENWYMGSTLARSAMQKNRFDALNATD